jgi:hypothetical protein
VKERNAREAHENQTRLLASLQAAQPESNWVVAEASRTGTAG